MTWMIARLGKAEPIRLAAEELMSYLRKMDPDADIALLAAAKYDPTRKNTLWVGEDAAFDSLLPEVADRALDDGIYIQVEAGCGIVTGANARSVLLAAYRLLKENGCAFLTPERNGELISKKPLSQLNAQVREKPSSRHRGVCIEGGVSFEHVVNMIRFLPKLGMNAYFIQFFAPVCFFDRWYTHRQNPLFDPQILSREEIMELKAVVEEEITKRGLMYHAVGHGWTCEPFGIPGDGWTRFEGELPEEITGFLAEVSGKREPWYGVMLNTNLCYGQNEVRDRITTAIADYCEAHPEVGFLHFWLADGNNNHCECGLCRDTTPADFYVRMLNELDKKLTAKGVPTKIVFLIYVDLLWEPETERIENADRFVMMFAPITRTYSEPFLPGKDFEGELPPFRRNKNIMPNNVAENVARLKRWQAQFDGDSFVYDYHFMWDHHKDMGYYDTARLLMSDMKNLGKIGINGMVSCQNQRVFFPNGLGMHAMAQGLWDHHADFDALANEYFAAAYGEMAHEAQEYLSGVSRLLNLPYVRHELEQIDEKQEKQYAELKQWATGFIPTAARGMAEAKSDAVRHEWRKLCWHTGLIERLADALQPLARGDREAVEAAWQPIEDYACQIETEFPEAFDLALFLPIMRNRVLLSKNWAD